MYCLTSNEWVQHFENGGKNTSFINKDDSVLVKYNEIWNKIKKKLNTKFYSMYVYDEKYTKAKVSEFNGVTKTNFWGDKKVFTKRRCVSHVYRLYNY